MAAIVSAVVVNAASVTWSIETAYAPTGDELGDVTGYYAFFMVDSISATDAGQSTVYTRAAAEAQIASGSVAFLSNALGSATEIEYGAGAGNLGSFVNNNTVGAYLVLLDAISPADATKAYLSNVLTTDINGMGASATLNWGDMVETATAGNWSTVGNVPEPTSGLLLILGMAGLALKRKRA